MNCNKFNFSVWEIHLFYGKSSNRPHLSHSRNREGAGKQCAPTVWSSIRIPHSGVGRVLARPNLSALTEPMHWSLVTWRTAVLSSQDLLLRFALSINDHYRSGKFGIGRGLSFRGRVVYSTFGSPRLAIPGVLTGRFTHPWYP